jgi:2-polyprenyl-3-methyl-5-hydroxy-6-metoxy-1,4-benzoquinol methylase
MEYTREPIVGDAFGRALLDYTSGGETHYVVEREDGYIDPSSLEQYFLSFPNWSALEKRMPEYVRGRVLDIGCGAGKHIVHLQKLGYEVVGIDASPGAVDAAKSRGAKRVFPVSIDELVVRDSPAIGEPFDSVIMMGNNLGLLHSFDEARVILKWLHGHTTPSARVIGMTRNPKATKDPLHIAYQESNIMRGRMPGQIHFRIRHRNLSTKWYDYLFMSEGEMSRILDDTGWNIEEILKDETDNDGGYVYIAVIAKEN